MPEKQRKTLKERLLDEGVKDRYFMMNSENNKKVYTVTGMEGGDLEIKYRNNKKTKVKAISHLDDLEVIIDELIPGSFYEILSKSKNEIAHFTENGYLIDSKGNNLDKNKTKDLLLIEDVRGYMDALKEDSRKNEECVKFMERYFFRNKFEKLHDEELSLEPVVPELETFDDTLADTALTGLDLGDAGYDTDTPELETFDDTLADTALTGLDLSKDRQLNAPGPSISNIEDVNLDSFGSGSGLLDLSLQADDTSLGGILDEIYTAEDGNNEDNKDYDLSKDRQLNAPGPSISNIEDVNLDSFGSGSGLLDLSLIADDVSLGGILDEIYTAEDDNKTDIEEKRIFLKVVLL